MTVRLRRIRFGVVPTPSPLRQLADQALDGSLSKRLTEWRAKGKSWRWIAQEIAVLTKRGIDVSDVTVRAWARQLEIPEPAANGAREREKAS